MGYSTRVNLPKEYKGVKIPLYRDYGSPCLNIPRGTSHLIMSSQDENSNSQNVTFYNLTGAEINTQVLKGRKSRDVALFLESLQDSER